MNYDRGQQSCPILGSLKTTGWIVRHGEESTPVAACQTVRRYYTMTAASVERARAELTRDTNARTVIFRCARCNDRRGPVSGNPTG